MINNPMDEKQLDFNQPLLSVRRFPSIANTLKAADGKNKDRPLPKIPPIPAYKSELKSGPVCHPGSVPFQWEQMPGRPKNERKTQKGHCSQHPPIPKLPPGRIKHEKQLYSKGEKAGLSQMNDVPSTYQMVSSLNKHTIIDKRTHNELKVRRRSSSSDDDDEAYLDALDSLSRTESFINCSVNGLSGVDGAEVKPSGVFATDAQARSFMMDRFLPAAKAMASELPEYATRKQLVPNPPKEVDHDAAAFKGNSVQQRRRMVLLHHMQNEVKESDEDSDEFDEPDYLSATFCGLFPRLCLKGSFCVMNPTPGLRMQAGAKVSSGHTAQAKTSYRSSCCRNESELPVEAAHQQKSRDRNQMTDLNGEKLNQQSENQKPDVPSLCRNVRDSGVSPYPNQPSQSYKGNISSDINGSAQTAELSGKNGLNPHRKRRSSFQELLAMDPANCEQPHVYPAVEKTLCIDPVNTEKLQNSISSVLSTLKVTSNYKGDDFDALVKNEETTNNSSSRDTELNLVDANTSPSPKTSSSESASLSPVDSNNETQKVETKNYFPQPNLLQDSTILDIPQLPDDVKINSDDKLPQEADKESFHALSQKLSLPPLPKSPSESWLQRTLPASSIKSQSSRSSTGAGNDIKIQSSKPPLVPKWENLVRTSKAHHSHMLFSEDRLTVIPEN